jgi:hypothetical protein
MSVAPPPVTMEVRLQRADLLDGLPAASGAI